MTLSWQVKAIEGLLPATLSKLIYPIDKSNLDALRLLHFLALALAVVRLMPTTGADCLCGRPQQSAVAKIR